MGPGVGNYGGGGRGTPATRGLEGERERKKEKKKEIVFDALFLASKSDVPDWRSS